VAQPLSDTDADTARVHEELVRRASPARRLELACSLSHSVIQLSREGLRRSLGEGVTDEEVALRFVELHYGADLAEGVRRCLAARRP
jgi:hypothetical protein